MDGRSFALLFALIGSFVAIVSMALSRSRRESEQQRRMDLIEKGLAHPALDEATRAELLRLLTAEQCRASATFGERLPRLAPAWRTIWYGAGWLLFVFSGCMLGANALELTPGLEARTFVPLTILGFAMLTLPLALGELQARRARSAPAER